MIVITITVTVTIKIRMASEQTYIDKKQDDTDQMMTIRQRPAAAKALMTP